MTSQAVQCARRICRRWPRMPVANENGHAEWRSMPPDCPADATARGNRHPSGSRPQLPDRPTIESIRPKQNLAPPEHTGRLAPQCPQDTACRFRPSRRPAPHSRRDRWTGEPHLGAVALFIVVTLDRRAVSRPCRARGGRPPRTSESFHRVDRHQRRARRNIGA